MLRRATVSSGFMFMPASFMRVDRVPKTEKLRCACRRGQRHTDCGLRLRRRSAGSHRADMTAVIRRAGHARHDPCQPPTRKNLLPINLLQAFGATPPCPRTTGRTLRTAPETDAAAENVYSRV